jgi:serine/threonine-protein kinase
LELAGRLSDGTPVDWNEAHRSANDADERETLRFLEKISSLLGAQRRLRATGAAPGSSAPGGESARDDFGAATLPGDPRLPQATPAQSRWGRLELRGALGAGSFADVYRAFDPDLGREVALKLLHSARESEGSETVLREGRMMARVRHPNVVTVHGAERHEGRVGIWMELVRGRTIDVLRREQGTFSAREAALVGLDLCRALTAVHQAGLVHRDINTRNVMRADGGRIVLMDFGTGREAADTGAGTAGTPYFMAPEVLRGGPATASADLYSVGVLLFHLVTGSFPARGGSLDELRATHASGKVTLLREARADLEAPFVRVVEKALAADPAARWASAGQLEQALANALGIESQAPHPGQPDDAAPPRSPVAARARGTRAWSRPALMALPVLAVAAAVGFSLRGRDGSTTTPTNPSGSNLGAPGPGGALPSMQVQAAFYRRRGATRERIEPGARVGPGDGIALELESSTPVHVYVVNEDERGQAHLLFPLPGFEPTNPLAPGRRWVLPGTRAGAAFDWEVSSAGGRERLLVVASRERLADLEADLLSLPQASPDGGMHYAQLTPQSVERLRGIGALRARPPDPAAAAPNTGSSRLDEIAAQVSAGSETVPGVWVRRVEFDNPASP